MSTKSRLRKFRKSDFEKKNIFGMLRLSFMQRSVRFFDKTPDAFRYQRIKATPGPISGSNVQKLQKDELLSGLLRAQT